MVGEVGTNFYKIRLHWYNKTVIKYKKKPILLHLYNFKCYFENIMFYLKVLIFKIINDWWLSLIQQICQTEVKKNVKVPV